MAEQMDNDDLEVLNISDDGDQGDAGAQPDETVDGDDQDRGDDFIDPEAEEPADDQPAGDDREVEDDEDDKGKAGVPFGRLNEVARVKSAATAIVDAVVSGEIDPQTIKDLGGANAVSKAVANREITLDELKSYDGSQPAAAAPTADQGNGEPTAGWNLDEKYVEYQELVDAGETKEAAILLRQINREERALERAEEVANAQQVGLDAYVSQVMSEHPELADVKSREHEEVMVWANHLQATQRITRQAALAKAIDRVFGEPVHRQEQRGAKAGETEQQRVLRERREAAVMRGASASRQQPPPMNLGATPQGPAKLDPTKYSNDEWDKLSVDENEKRRARGDFI